MKKLICIAAIFLSIFLGVQDVIAADYSKISTNPKIVSALTSLEGINRRDVLAILKGNNATRKPIRVLFRDLSVYGYKNCEAVTIKTKDNGLIIYISSKHRNARPECIACLIAHESQHHTFTNSKSEELRAWISENNAWNEFARRDKTLLTSTEHLAKRENYIARLKSKNGVIGIQKLIAANPVYANLN